MYQIWQLKQINNDIKGNAMHFRMTMLRFIP